MKKTLALVAGVLITAPAWGGYWVDASGGYIPVHAYQVGVEPDGGPLFLCKGLYNGAMYQGAINPGFNGCDITVNGNIITLPRYTVWVADDAPPAYVNSYFYGPGYPPGYGGPSVSIGLGFGGYYGGGWGGGSHGWSVHGR